MKPIELKKLKIEIARKIYKVIMKKTTIVSTSTPQALEKYTDILVERFRKYIKSLE
jgi:hypothetical protein